MNIIIQPCGIEAKSNYQNTIEFSSHVLEDIKPYISEEDFQTLMKIYPDKKFKVWGITKGKNNVNKKKWDKLNINDIVLFSGKTGTYQDGVFTSARIAYKTLNSPLAEYLWPNYETGKPWECVYFIKDQENINIPYRKINKLLNWSTNNPDFPVRGFMRLNDKQSATIISYLNTISTSEFVEELNDSDYDKMITDEEDLSEITAEKLDSKVVTNRRKEQSFLRKKLLKNNDEGICSICGKKFPKEFLWCSHVKLRNDCTLDEKRDWKNIVTLMCKFGCDDLYEKNYIGIKDGKVVALKETTNNIIKEYIKSIEGNICPHYSNENKKYYDYHNEHYNDKH